MLSNIENVSLPKHSKQQVQVSHDLTVANEQMIPIIEHNGYYLVDARVLYKKLEIQSRFNF